MVHDRYVFFFGAIVVEDKSEMEQGTHGPEGCKPVWRADILRRGKYRSAGVDGWQRSSH